MFTLRFRARALLTVLLIVTFSVAYNFVRFWEFQIVDSQPGIFPYLLLFLLNSFYLCIVIIFLSERFDIHRLVTLINVFLSRDVW